MPYRFRWDPTLILLWIAAFGSLFSAALFWAALRAGVWILCATVVSAIRIGTIFNARALIRGIGPPSRA